MRKSILYTSVVALFLASCQSEPVVEHYLSVNGEIEGAQGKFIKIIDMTKSGFVPDSIMLDENGRFAFSQKCDEPTDFVLYIEPEENIRILPCPDEQVAVVAKYPNISENYTVTGSQESERLAELLKKHNHYNYVLDTLNHYYMAHQLDRNFGDIVAEVRALSDSVLVADRQLHERFIKQQPGSLASYVALSSKLGLRTNLFNIISD